MSQLRDRQHFPCFPSKEMGSSRSSGGAEGTELLPHWDPEPFHGRYRKVLKAMETQPPVGRWGNKGSDENTAKDPE